MRILFQAYGIDRGGGIANVQLLLQAYARKFSQDQLIVVCSKGSPLENLIEFENCRVIKIPNDALKEARRLYINGLGLRCLQRGYRTDIVWGLNLGSYVRLQVPQVLSVHNSYQLYPFQYAHAHPEGPIKEAVLRWFFRRSLRCSDAVIVQTKTMERLIKKINQMPLETAVIPKAVENQKDISFVSLSEEVKNLIEKPVNGVRPFSFLYVGTNMPHKNHRTVILAIERLRNRGVILRLVLTISKKEAIASGKRKALELIEEGLIIPIGWVPKKYLRALYQTCDACVMPSKFESLSSANLEAMSWERAQIVSDLAYARELCGNAALYAVPSDPEDWATKMELLAQDKELRKKLIENGIKRMCQFPPTWEDAASMIRLFLQKTLTVKK